MKVCIECRTFEAEEDSELCQLCANKGNFPPEFNANALPELIARNAAVPTPISPTSFMVTLLESAVIWWFAIWFRFAS